MGRTIASRVGSFIYMDPGCTYAGVKHDAAIVSQVDDLGTAVSLIERALGVVDLVVVDTVHSFDFAPHIPYGMDDHTAMQQAWKDALRRLGPAVAQSRTTVLLLSHLSPVVYAVWDRSSTYVTFIQKEPINFGAERIGHWVESSVRTPDGSVVVRAPLYFDTGFDAKREARFKK